MSPLRARIRPDDLRRLVRAPVFCATARAVSFVLFEMHGENLRALGPCPLGDRPAPICLPLPRLVYEVEAAPGFACPRCGGNGHGTWFQCAVCRNGDLVHCCPPGHCACGQVVAGGFNVCLRMPVRGELVTPPKDRVERPAPPGLSARVQPGGGK